jgi:hypothetical protein
MYRKQIFQKVPPSLPSTPISKEIVSSPSYGSLSSVVQRVQQDPNSVSGEERQELESAIGTKSTREILTGKQTPWVPEFQGISAQLWGHSAPLQAKLTIGEAGDKYEQEADNIAAKVVEQINHPVPVSLTPSEVVQSKKKEEGLRMKPMVQLKEAIGGIEASTDLQFGINHAKGSGQSLNSGLQQSMGQAMGADFSGVKIHTDTQSDQLNRSLQAKAFTTGNHIFFKSGEYKPSTRDGQNLIAHELTHVTQQGMSIPRKDGSPLIQRVAIDVPLHEDMRDMKVFGASDRYYQDTNEDDNHNYNMVSIETREYPYIDTNGLLGYSGVVFDNMGGGDVSPYYRVGQPGIVYNANPDCQATIGLHPGQNLLTVSSVLGGGGMGAVNMLIATRKTMDEKYPQHVSSHVNLDLGNAHVHYYDANPMSMRLMLGRVIKKLETDRQCLGQRRANLQQRNVIGDQIRQYFGLPRGFGR